MRAVLALDGEDFKRHSGVIQYFQKNYIKSGIFDKRFSDIITKASRIRNASDYDDFYIASRIFTLFFTRKLQLAAADRRIAQRYAQVLPPQPRIKNRPLGDF